MRRRLSLVLVIASLLGSFPAMAEKVDLSPFLGGFPSVGDTRIYSISNGGELVQEIIQVQLVGKAWRVVTHQQETGQSESFVEGFIVPGKELLLGDSESAPLSIVVKKPKRLQRFVFQFGKPQRARIKGIAFAGSNFLGPAAWSVESELLGLEPLDTGIGYFPETALVRMSTGLSISDVLTGDQILVFGTQTSWITPLLGAVAYERRIVSFLNGFLQSDTGIQTLLLTSAVIGGLQYP